jgi:hypothetical protein
MPPASRDHLSVEGALILDRLDSLEGRLNETVRELRAERERGDSELFARHRALEVSGCAMRPVHDAKAADVEGRIRKVEEYQFRQSGAVAAVGAAAGVGGAGLAFIGKFIWSALVGKT